MLGRSRKKSGGFRRFVFLGAAAALGTYFFDPQMGRTRRARVVDQGRALLRRGTRDIEQKTGDAGQQAYGAPPSTASTVSPDSSPANDETLKEKIESEVLRGDEWPKGRLNIDVVDGVVTLRGELDDVDLGQALEQEVRKVSGVIDVQNLVHLPASDAPNKEAALEASRRAEGSAT